MSERFYVSAIGPDETVQLTGAEAHYLARVRRIRRGARVDVFDGSGAECAAVVREIGPAAVTLTIEARSHVNRELPFSLTLACAPAKGERFRWLVEKATELGVTSFVPIVTGRSSEQARAAKAEKMQRWVIEGCKQCGRNILMKVCDPVDWPKFLDSAATTPLRLLADPRGVPLGSVLGQPIASDVALAVGPEGGFTMEELQAAASRGWIAVNLGRRILRVETAVVALVARVTADC